MGDPIRNNKRKMKEGCNLLKRCFKKVLIDVSVWIRRLAVILDKTKMCSLKAVIAVAFNC
jgi:hypothetical protein